MGEKKEKEYGKQIESFFKTNGPNIILKTLKGFIDKLAKSVTDSIHKTERKFLETLVAYVTFTAALLFIGAAAIMLIAEYSGLSMGWSLLVVGLLLMVISMLHGAARRIR
jgi:hypothetical protein